MTGDVHMRPLAVIARGEVSAVDVTRACMAAIVNGESGPHRLNAFISYDYDAAQLQAEQVDAAADARQRRPLAGVPVAIKDNICTLGLPTTCASRILAGYRSPFEATAVRRLRDAGAIIVGKTNLDEFAMGSSTAASAFGPTFNPHDVTRVPGGSSGGSAAAVAAGMVPAALGSDTGGSVRQPAAFCGVVGIRPTYGRVSRYGLVAFASSLDQIGVFGRSVADAMLLLNTISGADRYDATCADVPAPASSRGIPVVGVPREYFTDDVDAGVRRACEHAIDVLRARGCVIRDVSLPHTRLAVAACSVISAAEASTNLARFDGVRYGVRGHGADVYGATRTAGFGSEVKRRIMFGTLVLTASHCREYYTAAQRVRALIAREFAHVFDAGVDVIFTPTTPTPAFEAGSAAGPYEMYAADVFTAPASLAGLPAMSVPVGSAGGLPIGGQIIARHWREDLMSAAAALIERGMHTLTRPGRGTA